MAIREIVKPRHGSLNYDTNEAGDDAGLECKDPSLAVQSQKADADINVVMKRFGITGAIPVVQLPPEFGDFSIDMDFREIQDVMNAAKRSFMSLSADVRARFLNDPIRFVEFASDAKNLGEMRKLGLAPEAVAVPEGDARSIGSATLKDLRDIFSSSTEAKPK